MKGIFDTDFASQFNIYIPDLPGFGKSEFNKKYLNLIQVIILLRKLIEKYSAKQKLIIIGHSLYDLLQIPNAGHWPMLENPNFFWELISSIIMPDDI